MSDIRQHLKEKAVHETREYLVMSFYLFVVFSLLVVHKSVILAEHHVDYSHHGFALINALALAKVMLMAQELHLGDWFEDTPLIYPTLLKSFLFTVVLACFKIAEDFVLGRIHGRSFQESLSDFGGGTWKEIMTVAALGPLCSFHSSATPSCGGSSDRIAYSRSFSGRDACGIHPQMKIEYEEWLEQQSTALIWIIGGAAPCWTVPF